MSKHLTQPNMPDTEAFEGVVVRQESPESATLKSIWALITIVTSLGGLALLVHSMVQPMTYAIDNLTSRLVELEKMHGEDRATNELVHVEFSKELAGIKEKFIKTSDDIEDLKELTNLRHVALVDTVSVLQVNTAKSQDLLINWRDWWLQTQPVKMTELDANIKALSKDLDCIRQELKRLEAGPGCSSSGTAHIQTTVESTTLAPKMSIIPPPPPNTYSKEGPASRSR